MMRRLLLGLGGLLLAASSGCAVCSSIYDCEYAAYGGRWDRGAAPEHGDRGNRRFGRVGSAFHPAEIMRPADGDNTELIPPGRPLVDEADDSNSRSGNDDAGDAEAEAGGAGSNPAPGTTLTPPQPPPQPPPQSAPQPSSEKTQRPATRTAPAKNSAKPNAGNRTNRGTQDQGWAAKPTRPSGRANASATADATLAGPPGTEEPAAETSEQGVVAGNGAYAPAGVGDPSTGAEGEAMTEEANGDASGASLQPPANE
jgi:hypothetical protein